MKITRALATLSAATLVPVVMLAAPAAHADQTWTGQVTEQDPTAVFIRPVHETEGCGTDGGQQATFNYDSVSFTSTTDGPRRFAVSSAGFQDFSIFVYVNGVCAKSDDDTESADEYNSNTIDVDNVQIAKGDKVEVRLLGSTSPWTLTVQQAGSSNAPAEGKATKYVGLPEQVVCGSGTATATLTKKAKKAKIRSIVFKANGQKVGKVKRAKIAKAVKKGVQLKGIPAGAVTLEVVVKGKKKSTASRPYSAC